MLLEELRTKNIGCHAITKTLFSKKKSRLQLKALLTTSYNFHILILLLINLIKMLWSKQLPLLTER